MTVFGVDVEGKGGPSLPLGKTVWGALGMTVCVNFRCDLFRSGFEFEGGGVHAVAVSGGLGAVGEDVAEVGVAFGTDHFGALHAEGAVVMGGDGIGFGGVEAGPSARGIEFSLRFEERLAAAAAGVSAGAVVVPIFSGEGAFGAFLAGDVELFGGELLAPLGFGFLDFSWHTPIRVLLR